MIVDPDTAAHIAALEARVLELIEVNNREVGRRRAAARARDLFADRLLKLDPFGTTGFQARAWGWITACFGSGDSCSLRVRGWRFAEEAIELGQAIGITAEEHHRLVDYVHGRPAGDPAQEIGGVMLTLAGLATAAGLDVEQAAETELARVWRKIDVIRAKQAAKTVDGPLPGPSVGDAA